MTDEAKTIELKLRLIDQYKFEIDFSEFGKIESDETPPLGEGHGPNPSRLLAAAVGNCLAASLLFAIRKFHEEPGKLTVNVKATIGREGNFWRVTHIAATLQLGNSAEAIPHLQRALAQFEDFCIVTQSVRHGIAVEVTVIDQNGVVIK
jgi:organic hydroperoxide reductase OsmC/OhrA